MINGNEGNSSNRPSCPLYTISYHWSWSASRATLDKNVFINIANYKPTTGQAQHGRVKLPNHVHVHFLVLKKPTSKHYIWTWLTPDMTIICANSSKPRHMISVLKTSFKNSMSSLRTSKLGTNMGYALETITRKSFEDVVQAAMIQPLGLTRWKSE